MHFVTLPSGRRINLALVAWTCEDVMAETSHDRTPYTDVVFVGTSLRLRGPDRDAFRDALARLTDEETR